MTQKEAEEATSNHPVVGPEWVMTFVEDGKAKVCSTPSEEAALRFMAHHPEGTLHFGRCLVFEVDLPPERKEQPKA